MRHLILLGSLALLANPVLAEDVAVSPLPPAEGTSTIQYSAPAEADQAARKVELFRRTIQDTARTKSLFNLFSSPTIPIDGELLQEMDRYIQRYRGQPETAEVFHLKAQVHHRMEAYSAAALDWLMLTVLYPDSAFAIEAEKRLNELGGDQLKKQAATLREMTQRTKGLNGDRDHRIAAYLTAVANTSSEPGFAAPIAAECAAFLVNNQTYRNEDDIEHALARQAMLIDPQIAIYHFDKLLALYPDSPFRPDSLLSIATIQRKTQHAYDRAAQTFSQLIRQYPDSAETTQGYESLAAMYDEDMHDYPNAIKTYDEIVAKYRDGAIVLRALNNVALIYQNRTNQPAKAIDSYLKIATIFKGPEVLDALNKAEKIATYTTHDWKSAIEINDRIVAYAPYGDDAAKAMFANAEITENELNDKVRAKALYEKLIASQPNHPLARDAQKRIAAMERK
jgi:tetratricopeptide (TPR) repeat protein